jgi:hypothetical protein
MVALQPRPDFYRASELPRSPIGSIEELEQRIKDQDAIIAEQQELIDELSRAPRLARTPSDALKDSERLILLARINDLTIANNALEFDLKKSVKALQERLDEVNATMAVDIAYDRRRISALERIPQRLTTKLDARLKKLDHALVSRRNQPMTFSEIGKILELGSRSSKTNTRRQAMTKFSKILLSNVDCYSITDSKIVHSKLVRLTDSYYQKLLRGRREV